MKFLSDNWFNFISILIAISGGIPGILSLIQAIRSKTQFAVSPSSTVVGLIQFGNETFERTHVFIALTISNNGSKPLTPSRFNFSYRIKGEWVPFEPLLIPENLSLPSETQTIKIPDASKRDLQKYQGAITQGMPVGGFLMFTTPGNLIENLDKKMFEFKFTCTDVFGKNHIALISKARNQIVNPTAFPKHGIQVSIRPPRKNEGE